jgi:hypothetical protein
MNDVKGERDGRVTPAPASPDPGAPRRSNRPAAKWLVLVHQLPPSPSNLRVRTWRRLQQLGAVAVKQAVYVLPDSPAAREDFEWLRAEIDGAGGEASVLAADFVDAWSDAALIEEFRRSRQEAYLELAREIEAELKPARAARRARRPAGARPRQRLEALRQRLAAIDRTDFFGSAGRDRVQAALTALEAQAVTAKPGPSTGHAAPASAAQSYRNRLWVTRPRPGVDRMASAWLIRQFIDRGARFAFVADARAAPRDAVPFDMFGVDFSHHGEQCTFETLCGRFALQDEALPRIAAIVHDLDLKDGRFGAPEAPAIGLAIDGLQLSHPDDHLLLEQGMKLFEALYRAFAHAARRSGPRPVARRARPASRR